MLGQSITKNGLLLGAFALVTAAVLATTHLATRDRIAIQERAAQQRALFEILPPETHDNDLLNDVIAIPKNSLVLLGLPANAEDQIHLARNKDVVNAVIVPTITPDGYSGDIRLIVGVKRNGEIAGVRTLTHRETPGLGDKVDLKKSQWILSFNGKSLEVPLPEQWKVKKDGGTFDQFAGATITPRAVVTQVKQVLEFVQTNHAYLFGSEQKVNGEHQVDSKQIETGESHE